MTDLKARSLVLLVLALSLFTFGLLTTEADEPTPSPADYQNLDDIKSNQKILEKNREAYEAFLKAKSWNEAEVRELNKNGWNVDWSSMKLVPFAPGQESPENLQASVGTWAWKDAPAYKNDRLKAYQGMLKARGITDPDKLKLLTAQIIQENGSLSENVHGDNGCSVGVLQYNACVHHNQSAKKFLETHPEWKSWEYQFERMADMVADRMEIYDGNMKQVVVHHNGPAFAKRGVDTPAGYYKSVLSRTSLLTSL